MREIRLSGSEGGGTELNRSSLPLSSSVAAPRQSAGEMNGHATAARVLANAATPSPRQSAGGLNGHATAARVLANAATSVAAPRQSAGGLNGHATAARV